MGAISKMQPGNAIKKWQPFKNPQNLLLGPVGSMAIQEYNRVHGLDNGNPEGSPFSISPEEIAANRAAIEAEGQRQYGQTNEFIGKDAGSREAARAKLAESLSTQAQNTFRKMLPGTEETLNAQHLLNGSGLGQELGRQQGYLAQDIASQVGQLGAQDIYTQSAQKGAALQGLQGMQTAALNRGFSLEDFIRQANVAKTIGAQMAPQVNNGKGTAVSGIGAGAAAGAPFGPWGSAAGGALGYLAGSQKGK